LPTESSVVARAPALPVSEVGLLPGIISGHGPVPPTYDAACAHAGAPTPGGTR
jgi:hypothetical protein